MLPEDRSESAPARSRNTFSSTYFHHRKLKSWELWLDDIKFKAREMRQPLSSWRLRHFCALYALSRFVVRPVLYFPGIMSFYCLQPGRRLSRIWKSVPFKLPKLMAEPFWVSGEYSYPQEDSGNFKLCVLHRRRAGLFALSVWRTALEGCVRRLGRVSESDVAAVAVEALLLLVLSHRVLQMAHRSQALAGCEPVGHGRQCASGTSTWLCRGAAARSVPTVGSG